MSLILFPIFGVLLCIVLIAYFALKIMLVSVAINGVIAGLVAFFWRVTEPAKLRRKKDILIFGSLAIQIFVLNFAILQAKNTLFPDRTDYREKHERIGRIMNNAGIDNKFEQVYAIAASAKKIADQQALERDIVDEFRRSATDTYFSDVDLAAAQAIYIKEQNALGNAALDPCKSETTGLYTRTVVHRDGPVSLISFLENYPPQTSNTCPELLTLLSFIHTRCEQVWAWRCAQELDRTQLQGFTQAPTPDDIAKKIQAFIRTVWPNHH